MEESRTVKEMLTGGDSRGATSQDPNSGKKGKKEKRQAKGAFSKVTEATAQSPATEESLRLSSSEESSEESSEQSSQESQETNPNTNNKKKKSKFAKNVKVNKILPFQGKSRFPMWIEVLKGGLPDALLEYLNKITDGEIDPGADIPKKLVAYDQALNRAIMTSLLDPKATPENDATSLFNRLTSHQRTIKRSGMRAILYMQEAVNGATDIHNTTLIQELLTIRVIHNNAEGVSSFCQKFRTITAKLGDDCLRSYGIETLRARLMGGMGLHGRRKAAVTWLPHLAHWLQ